MNPELSKYINRYIDISEDEDELFQSYLKKVKLKKKGYLLKEGETCRSRYFIIQGCLRLYYLDQKGNEQILHFGIENWWVSNYDSLINCIPSHLNIQAIESCEVLELKQDSLDELYNRVPKLERFFRVIMERTFIASQRRIEYMFSFSSEEIYESFVTLNPQFVQRIPQYMLASYLGITPEYLSALRKNS